MTERKLQNLIGTIIISCYIFTIILVVVSGESIWITDAEYPEALYILLPLFGVYVIGIARNIVANRHQVVDNSPAVTGMFRAMAFLLTIVFNMFIIGVIVKESIWPGDAEKFLGLLCLSETAFGVFLGIFLKALFPEIEVDPNKVKPKAAASPDPKSDLPSAQLEED